MSPQGAQELLQRGPQAVAHCDAQGRQQVAAGAHVWQDAWRMPQDDLQVPHEAVVQVLQDDLQVLQEEIRGAQPVWQWLTWTIWQRERQLDRQSSSSSARVV